MFFNAIGCTFPHSGADHDRNPGPCTFRFHPVRELLGKGSVAARVLTRTEHAFTEIPTCTNPYLNFILLGRFPLHALPHYMRRENFDPIRENLDRLKLFKGTLSEALSHYGNQTFDAFNLSDIFEYVGPEEYLAQLGEIADRAAPGARLAFWNMLVPRAIPDGLGFRAETERAEALLRKDKAFFYSRFHVGGREK